MNLCQPLSFYSSVLFVIQAAFISEQTTKYRFGALLEISEKLNVFSFMIASCWPNILESFITILYDLEKERLSRFA